MAGDDRLLPQAAGVVSGRETSALPYRRNVGIALFNAQGEVLIGRRFRDDGPEIVLPGLEWQMPQGGIDEGEESYPAALLELREETNIRSVSKLGEIEEWLSYDIPRDIVGEAWGGKYRGQKQKWYALRRARGEM